MQCSLWGCTDIQVGQCHGGYPEYTQHSFCKGAYGHFRLSVLPIWGQRSSAADSGITSNGYNAHRFSGQVFGEWGVTQS